MMPSALNFDVQQEVQLCDAGLFVSRGTGKHANRIMDHWELIFVRSGVLRIREDGQDFTVNKNQSLTLWPGKKHEGIGIFPKDLSFYWIHFTIPETKNAKNKKILTIPRLAYPQRPTVFLELFHRLIGDMKENAIDDISASLITKLILWEASRIRHAFSEEENAMAALAKKVNKYILAHCHKPVSTSMIAADLMYNPDYLNRAFKQTYGKSITEAILHEKIEESCELLRESNLNINEISQSCGFSNVSYFRRVFKKNKGVTPLTYRKFHDQDQISWRCT